MAKKKVVLSKEIKKIIGDVFFQLIFCAILICTKFENPESYSVAVLTFLIPLMYDCIVGFCMSNSDKKTIAFMFLFCVFLAIAIPQGLYFLGIIPEITKNIGCEKFGLSISEGMMQTLLVFAPTITKGIN